MDPSNKMDVAAERMKEKKLYPLDHRHDVTIKGKLIGYAIARGSDIPLEDIYGDDAIQKFASIMPMLDCQTFYWCGYYILPTDIDVDDIDLHVAITHQNKDIIGWDHLHYIDSVKYTNLTGVIDEVYTVHKAIKKYLSKKDKEEQSDEDSE